LGWGRLQWPNDWPRSIGDFASRVSDPLAGELEALCSASYGPGGDDPTRGDSWNGENLAKALRSFAVKSNDTKDVGANRLPPLMPGSTA
jgi:hypothetical protein